jgi:hypothetical protein
LSYKFTDACRFEKREMRPGPLFANADTLTIWEKSPFKDSRIASISWAFVMTMVSDDSTGKTSFKRKTS